MDKRLMSTDELLGFSKQASEPVDIEIKDGMIIKLEPMGLIETLRMQEDSNIETPDGMANYMAKLISTCIIEPELNNEQREQLKVEILSWPSPLVNKIMSEYYEKIGVGEEELNKAIGQVEGFLEESH